jgi:FkbM family methyltransferase
MNGLVRIPMGIYVLQEDTHLSRWVEAAGTLEIPQNLAEIASFAHLIPEGGVVIDAGACLGDHTVTYSQMVGHEGHVYAFEPHPVTYKALYLNTARLTNVTTIQAALNDVEGCAQLRCDPNIGASFLTEEDAMPVSCRTLDSFLLPMRRCDFLHLDAEGYEPRILRGGRKFLQRFRPAMVIEICDQHLRRAGSSEAELMALLHELGYDVHAVPSHIEPELRDVMCLPRAA